MTFSFSRAEMTAFSSGERVISAMIRRGKKEERNGEGQAAAGAGAEEGVRPPFFSSSWRARAKPMSGELQMLANFVRGERIMPAKVPSKTWRDGIVARVIA